MSFKSLLALTGVAVGAFAIVAYFKKRKQAEPISICPYTKEPCDFKSCDECQHDYHLSKKSNIDVDPSAFLTPDEKLYESDLDWEQATAPDDESECSDISDDEPEYFDTSDDEYEDETELDWEQATTSDESDDEPEYFANSDDEPEDEPEYFKTSDEDKGDTSYFDISDEDEATGTSASDDFYDLDTASDKDEDTGTSASDDFDDIDTASDTGTTDEREIYRHLEVASDEFDSVEEVDTPEYRPEVSAIE